MIEDHPFKNSGRKGDYRCRLCTEPEGEHPTKEQIREGVGNAELRRRRLVRENARRREQRARDRKRAKMGYDDD